VGDHCAASEKQADAGTCVMTMTIGTTMLESFRLFMHPDNEWMTEDRLLADIRGEFHPTYEMMLGTAYGRAIEKPEKWRLKTDAMGPNMEVYPAGSYRVPVKGDDGWHEFFFRAPMVDRALSMLDRSGVFEVRGQAEYDGWIVVAKLDQISGTRINENKTTTKYFDFDKYAPSCQWRFYLDIFGADAFTYNVFEIREKFGEYSLGNVESFNLFPYEAMHQDCLTLVRQFKAYVQKRGLEGVLQERAEQNAKYTAALTL
jgi:hypothetical protein